MRKEDLARVTNSGGALLIADKAIIQSYGYEGAGEEVPASVFEDIRNRQAEVNAEKISRKVRRKAWPSSRLIGRADAAVAVVPVGDEAIGGDDHIQAATGAEVCDRDVEGHGPVLHVQANETRREARDVCNERVVLSGDFGGDSDHNREWVGSAVILSPTISIAQCAPFSGSKEGIDDNPSNINPT